ncbi:LPXTG cell wall anchor domain-containing protein [Alkalicoccobacillus murimartini]|uniref:LPXTG-motif cell wall-anchored protein n=1 Tax=Alkalicoccobacillus murimartini TaxID=171685 RepID=A0ABT9YJD4_9BACI|nr:LPXTG cell wall anchor domain-containing protein [Alkalicoccobacillus murimartini]MDQ0207836.1 LPXTG-motif cell wall-anchored protein [Alkalicoccobacillus murimartini]
MLRKTIAPLCLVTLLSISVPSLALADEDSNAVDILNQSNEAMLELDSYSSETVMEMTMEGIDGEEVTITTTSEEDVTMNPFALHQIVTTSIPGEAETTLESYWTEDGFYQETADGEWTKLPDELSEELNELMGMAMAGDQVEQAEAFGDDMSVEDTGDSYILTYDGDGEAIEEAMQEWMDMSMGDDEAMMLEELLNQITYNEINYEMTIEKDTYYMTDLTMYADMDIEFEGESTNMTQSIDMNVHNFNGVGSIEVPEDVKNNATPLEDEVGGELPDTSTNNPMFALLGGAMTLAGAALWFRRRHVQHS